MTRSWSQMLKHSSKYVNHATTRYAGENTPSAMCMRISGRSKSSAGASRTSVVLGVFGNATGLGGTVATQFGQLFGALLSKDTRTNVRAKEGLRTAVQGGPTEPFIEIVERGLQLAVANGDVTASQVPQLLVTFATVLGEAQPAEDMVLDNVELQGELQGAVGGRGEAGRGRAGGAGGGRRGGRVGGRGSGAQYLPLALCGRGAQHLPPRSGR
jgi:hypothetical protein